MSQYRRSFAGLASSLLFTAVFPTVARSEEAVVNGQTYRVITATPVQGAPLPEPPPPPPRPKTLEEALADLTEQNRQLAASIDRLGRSIKEGPDEKRDAIYGVGAGVLVTTGQAQLILDANLKYVFACYYPRKGECLGAVSTIEAGQVRYHPIGLGIFRYDDRNDPLSAEFLPRGWDFMVTSGLDIRLMGSLFLRFQVAWFFPNPFDVQSYVQDRVKEDLAEWERQHNRNYAAARDQAAGLDTNTPVDFAEAEKENVKHISHAISDHTSKAWGSYKKAGQKPWFQLELRWEF